MLVSLKLFHINTYSILVLNSLVLIGRIKFLKMKYYYNLLCLFTKKIILNLKTYKNFMKKKVNLLLLKSF